jgi:hypothetical protein
LWLVTQARKIRDISPNLSDKLYDIGDGEAGLFLIDKTDTVPRVEGTRCEKESLLAGANTSSYLVTWCFQGSKALDMMHEMAAIIQGLLEVVIINHFGNSQGRSLLLTFLAMIASPISQCKVIAPYKHFHFRKL